MFMMKMSCLDYAMHYLYRYPKTEKEMKTQLMKKQYLLEEIEPAMKVLKAKKYIDDRQFAELYLNSEVVKKGKPLMLMQQKLLFKGVDKEIVQEVIKSLEEGIGDGTITRIIKEVDKYAAKEIDSMVIIQKLLAK
jgi:SOS response regulatory protein OraA/RecX